MEWRPNWERPRFSVGSESSLSSSVEDGFGSFPTSPWPRSPPQSSGNGTTTAATASIDAINVPVGSSGSISGSFPGRLSMEYGSSALSETPGISFRRRSTRLSGRNSTVWLAAAAIDMSEQSHGHTAASSLLDLASVVRWPHKQLSLDKMPIEVLAIILQYVAIGSDAHLNLLNVVCTCGRLYDVGIAMLYRHMIFRYPQTFDKFRWSILSTGYGQHVRVIDFSAFTSVGLGRTQRSNMEFEMVTARTIGNALEQCPQILEFLAGESIDTDMNVNIMDKLLGGLSVLAAIDFCGASHPTFVHAIRNSAALLTPGYELWTLNRVSLHCCNTLPSAILETFLSRLVNVHMLDLTHTQLTGSGLLAIPSSARLSHLSIARCVRLDGESVVEFFASHPAVQNSLVWLSLMFDITRINPLSKDNLSIVLNSLSTFMLRHLNLYGHEPELQTLLKFTNLESLSIAHAVNLDLIQIQTIMSSLRNLQYINLMGSKVDSWNAQDIHFLNANKNIQMFEFGSEVLTHLQGVKIPGFVVDIGRGRRAWMTRLRPNEEESSKPLVEKPTAKFTFSGFAKEKIAARNQARIDAPKVIPKPPPMTDPIWRHASIKLNVSEVGSGPEVVGSEGIYNYYSFHTV